MPVIGFFDNGFTITQGGITATMAQPMTLVPTLSKRIDTYVFRDKTTTTVDAGKEMDRLTLTGLDFTLGTHAIMMKNILDMMDKGQRVYVSNLAIIPSVDAGYTGWYYITSFGYTRKAGFVNKYWYELVLDSET